MFVVSEAEAAAIRAVYEQRGEFAAAVELRRLLPGITDNAQARCGRWCGNAGRLPKRARSWQRRSARSSRTQGTAASPWWAAAAGGALIVGAPNHGNHGNAQHWEGGPRMGRSGGRLQHGVSGGDRRGRPSRQSANDDDTAVCERSCSARGTSRGSKSEHDLGGDWVVTVTVDQRPARAVPMQASAMMTEAPLNAA